MAEVERPMRYHPGRLGETGGGLVQLELVECLEGLGIPFLFL